MPPSIRNVIFDWSGTVVDDLPGVATAMRGVSEDLGGEPLTPERFRREFELPLAGFMRKVWPEADPRGVLESYLRHFPVDDPAAVSLLPGRAELLATLVATGRRIAICSSAPQVHVEAQAARLGVAAHLDQIWAGVMDKTAELPIRLEQWGARTEETLFVGDMTHDVEAARAAGVLSVATPSNYEPVERLLKSEPDLFMPDLNRLAAALGDARRFNEVFPLATVGALITNRAGQVLLVRTHKWSDRWGIPGGKIQRNESSEEALRRELLEETGLAVDDIRFVLVQDCVEPPEFERSAHFLLMNYVARVSQEDAEVRLNDEAEEWCWVTVEAALAMELNQPTRLLIDACVEQGMVG